MPAIDLHAAALVAVIAAVTILLRFAPFVVFGGGRPTPRYILYLARVLPCAIMAMLVLAIIPIVIFYFSTQRHIIEGVAAGAVKG